MKYSAWKSAFIAATSSDPKRAARLSNLEREYRIAALTGSFKRLVARRYAARLAGGSTPALPAVSALDDAIQETQPVSSKWLGSLQVWADTPAPNEGVTHLSATMVVRYRVGTDFDPHDPPRTVQLSPLKVRGSTIDSRFIWVTFDVSGTGVSRHDPTVVKRELGLDHFDAADYIYRVPLPISVGQPCFIPTCLDAGLNPPWSPPPRSHSWPWGLTRNLEIGQLMWPELLVEARAYLHTRARGDLVSPPGSRVAIGSLNVDYMIGR